MFKFSLQHLESIGFSKETPQMQQIIMMMVSSIDMDHSKVLWTKESISVPRNREFCVASDTCSVLASIVKMVLRRLIHSMEMPQWMHQHRNHRTKKIDQQHWQMERPIQIEQNHQTTNHRRQLPLASPSHRMEYITVTYSIIDTHIMSTIMNCSNKLGMEIPLSSSAPLKNLNQNLKVAQCSLKSDFFFLVETPKTFKNNTDFMCTNTNI